MSMFLNNSSTRWSVLVLSFVFGALGCSAQTSSGEDVDNTSQHLDVSRFQGWQQLTPGSYSSDPAVLALGGGTLEVFGRGWDDALYYDYFLPGAGWFGPSSLGGSIDSEPSASRWGSNQEEGDGEDIVAAIGTDGKVWVLPTAPRTDGTTGFTYWQQIPSSFALGSSPSVAFARPYLYIVATNSNKVTEWTRNDTTNGYVQSGWSAWAPIPSGSPAVLTVERPAITSSNGVVVVASLSTDKHYYFTTTIGTTWSAWQQVANGGVYSSAPALSGHGSTTVEITGRGTDDQFWSTTLDSFYGTFTSALPVGNLPSPKSFNGGPASSTVNYGSGPMVVIGRETDDTYWLNTWE